LYYPMNPRLRLNPRPRNHREKEARLYNEVRLNKLWNINNEVHNICRIPIMQPLGGQY